MTEVTHNSSPAPLWQQHTIQWFNALASDIRRAGAQCLAADMPGGAEVFLACGLHRETRRTMVWIGDGPRTLDRMARDFQTLAPAGMGTPLILAPLPDAPVEKKGQPGQQRIDAERIAVVSALQNTDTHLIVTCIQALLQPLVSREQLQASTMTFTRGADYDIEKLTSRLTDAGTRFVPEVQFPGDAAVRGGLVDIWPHSAQWPVRLEFFGATLDSIRTFDPETQRSIEHVESISIILRAPSAAGKETNPSSGLLAHLPDNAIFIWSDLTSIEYHAGLQAETETADGTPSSIPFEEFRAAVDARPEAFQLFIGSGPEHLIAPYALDFKHSLAVAPPVAAGTAMAPDLMESARRRYIEELAVQAARDTTVLIYFDTDGGLHRFEEAYGSIVRDTGIITAVNSLSGGFTSHALRLAVLAEADLYGRRIQRRRHVATRGGPSQTLGARISDWTDMEPGDLVVHVDHGIGRYLGLREITINEVVQEGLAIEYAEGARLYVPVAQAHLLTRYVGVGKRFTGLHKLGGSRWNREKIAAERAIQDFASQLLETQAARDSLAGHTFPPDTPWQHEFEAAFPYTETIDQERAITEVKTDMERPRPMDRLICGDAGYGKTEVAMRAAFKTVMNAKQVALLVPTTVLAQQHFQTFSERMAAFPVKIAMLSRFCSQREHDEIQAGLKDGSIDIVIGTHGLLQPAVQFRDLGLVIIDEEQRFGVMHKERFKHIRKLVDVLTMTATPIPRTLYMSLTGARDLSTIQTPPQDRIAVATRVVDNTDEIIREAILHEMNREGQVFYIYNRVMTIVRIAERIQALVPQARIGVAHGQMAAGELARIMRQFSSGDLDVLVSTTIVESGLDIPNANTILIDRADRFGLAELYQLRGRVGRASQKGFAYMLLPGRAGIDPIARKRIQAITQYTDLGAGFRLAMRDLEIRGAGNLLGTEQSGHITTVGFGLYCQLLKRTVALRKGEEMPPIVDVDLRLDFMDYSPSTFEAANSAVIPSRYIEDERLRVSMYRKIAEASLPADIRRLTEEFRDRFGPFPKSLTRLFQIALIRIVATGCGITIIETKDEKLMCTRDSNYLMPGGLFPRLRKRNPDGKLAEILAFLKKQDARKKRLG